MSTTFEKPNLTLGNASEEIIQKGKDRKKTSTAVLIKMLILKTL